MTIDDMLDDVLLKEGGFVNNPADRGGATKFGITQQTLSSYLSKPVSVEEMKFLDIKTAKKIYEQQYYKEPKINQLPDALQPFLFDAAVNHGPRQAIKFLQSVCIEAGYGPMTKDGVMGPKTKAKASSCYDTLQDWMLVALVEERQIFYVNIVDSRANQSIFLKGWMNRARSFLPRYKVQ